MDYVLTYVLLAISGFGVARLVHEVASDALRRMRLRDRLSAPQDAESQAAA